MLGEKKSYDNEEIITGVSFSIDIFLSNKTDFSTMSDSISKLA